MSYRHKWKDNVCVKCGVKRKRKFWKILMAIVNHHPWEGYSTGTDWAYLQNNGKWNFNRPNCNNKTPQP